MLSATMHLNRSDTVSSSDAEVGRIAELARDAGQMAFDTEFLPEGRYRPLLCLIQVVVGDDIVLLDPIAGFDHRLLAELFEDPDVEIVVHAGRQDVAILRREWRVEFKNLFDTQVAAGFAGFSAQAGYNGLLHDVLKIKLAKSASFTRWDARPLSDEQLKYAREDVEHLLPLASELQARLRANGRLEWAQQECLAIAQATDERDPLEVWKKLPRANSLRPNQRAVVRELAAWRERTAEAENRPVGAILRDQSVVELAKRQPQNRGEIANIRGIGSEVVRRRSSDIIAVIERGLSAEPLQLPEFERRGVEPGDGATISLCESLVRTRVLEANIAYELVASRADLTRIVVAMRRGDSEPDVRTLVGWRRELVGEELLDLLRGEKQLGVGARGRVEIT